MSQEFEIKDVTAEPIASVSSTTTAEGIREAMDAALTAVRDYLEVLGVQPAGPPFTRYHSVRPDGMEIECGFPTATTVTGNETVSGGRLPGGKVATAWHIGPYDQLGQSYAALEDWIKEQGLTPSGAPWEVYWTDPSRVRNPA